MDMTLPDWATMTETGVIEVDGAAAYTETLKRLDQKKPDQYWIEVARRCFTADLYDLCLVAGEAALRLRITASKIGRLANYPPEMSPEDLEQKVHREWLGHYKRLAPIVDKTALVDAFAARVKAGETPKLPKHPVLRAVCAIMLAA
ncbi:MAG: hypothetical protein ACTSWM_10065 [Alphaproteobacteria bacterium]